MSAPDRSGPKTPPSDPPQLASPSQLASMNQSAQQSGSTRSAGQTSEECPKKISWFSLTVMQTVEGAEQAVEGLTLHCHLPDLGDANGVTSVASPQVRFDNLTPGGTGDVLGTSHDDVVWEVTTDVS
jgi:hypothetical protein